MTPAIEVVDLVKEYPRHTAVAGISFQAKEGTCLGLIGPNGAGKTTTVEILTGLQPQTRGEVRLLGRTWKADRAFLRGRVGVQLQETQLYEKLTVEETVRLFRSFYRSGLEVAEAIQAVNLESQRRVRIGTLSGGQRQRAALAVALSCRPAVLFLDEPTTGLDPQSRRAFWNLVLKLKESGTTVVITTHFMDEAEYLCDHLIFVNHGKVIAEGTSGSLISRLGGASMIELETQPALPHPELGALPGVLGVQTKNGSTVLTVQELATALRPLLDLASARGVALTRISTRQPTLEDVFLSLAGLPLAPDLAA